MYPTKNLSLSDAMKVLNLLQAELKKEKGGAAVSVVDAHGELIAFMRTDSCPLPAINNAIHKAFTAARERKPSAEIGAASRSENFAMTNFGDLRYTGWGGGVPIKIDGVVVGAVGVSGLPEAKDVELAQMGARLFS